MKNEYKKNNGQHNPALEKWRKYDYLVKGLPIRFRQPLFHKLTWNRYGPIEQLTEEDEGFPWFRSIGLNDDQIDMIKENATRYFREVNEMMNKASRYPFYPHPEDAVASSKIHFDILKQVSYDEIVAFFGCEFEDYEPLRCNDGILERKDGKVFYYFDGWEYVFSDKDGDLILTPYGEPWHKTCVLHNAFSVSKLLEDNLVTMSGGKTYNIDSFCKLLADAILNKQQELDLSEL